MPRWFVAPAHMPGLASVRLTYYTNGDAVMELFVNGKETAEVSGPVCWHPETMKKRNQLRSLDPGTEPHFVYMKVNGITEVIEHWDGPVFQVSDDPELVRGAAAAAKCDKG